MMTPKQAQLLAYVREYLAHKGFSPSFDEMRAYIGLRSKSGIHRLVSGLEYRGLIRRLPHRARAIEVVEREATCPKCGTHFQPSSEVVSRAAA